MQTTCAQLLILHFNKIPLYLTMRIAAYMNNEVFLLRHVCAWCNTIERDYEVPNASTIQIARNVIKHLKPLSYEQKSP